MRWTRWCSSTTVTKRDEKLVGVEAVIDKDYTAALLASGVLALGATIFLGPGLVARQLSEGRMGFFDSGNIRSRLKCPSTPIRWAMLPVLP